MKTAAIICEYNPFHNGHLYHISETRKNSDVDGIIAIMSGNFVQRGDMAILPKQLRAEAAISGGVDLVIELPTRYACASAEFFATGAVKILNALGIVDYLSFGAESPNTQVLFEISKLLQAEPSGLSEKIKKLSDKGLSFPVARAKAIGEILGDEAEFVLSSPNNILAIEYMKALIGTRSSVLPLPILRKYAEHDSSHFSDDIASASYIRELLSKSDDLAFDFVPEFTKQLFVKHPLHSLKSLEKSILCELIKMPVSELEKIADVSEGLENRIKKAAMTAENLDELVSAIKTKRYTESRIRRILVSVLLGLTEEKRREEPKFIKVLAHNENGQKLIAKAKKSATLPILRNTSQVNKLKDPEITNEWESERRFDRIYELGKCPV